MGVSAAVMNSKTLEYFYNSNKKVVSKILCEKFFSICKVELSKNFRNECATEEIKQLLKEFEIARGFQEDVSSSALLYVATPEETSTKTASESAETSSPAPEAQVNFNQPISTSPVAQVHYNQPAVTPQKPAEQAAYVNPPRNNVQNHMTANVAGHAIAPQVQNFQQPKPSQGFGNFQNQYYTPQVQTQTRPTFRTPQQNAYRAPQAPRNNLQRHFRAPNPRPHTALPQAPPGTCYQCYRPGHFKQECPYIDSCRGCLRQSRNGNFTHDPAQVKKYTECTIHNRFIRQNTQNQNYARPQYQNYSRPTGPNHATAFPVTQSFQTLTQMPPPQAYPGKDTQNPPPSTSTNTFACFVNNLSPAYLNSDELEITKIPTKIQKVYQLSDGSATTITKSKSFHYLHPKLILDNGTARVISMIVDTGCSGQGVISKSFITKYNLESYKSGQKISVGVASGQNLSCDVYHLPLVFANNQAKPPRYFQFVAIDNCPATCLLGQAGLQKITLSGGKSAAEKFGEICQEIDAENTAQKN